MSAPAVKRLGEIAECSCCEKAWLVIARDGVGGRALNDELVVLLLMMSNVFV